MQPHFIRSALFSLTLAFAAQAGVVIVQTMQNLDDKSEPTTSKTYLDKDRARIDMGGKSESFFIYRGDKKLFWTVNLKDKTYMEVTEKDYEDMYAKLDEAKKKMQEQMEKMTPEQRKMMEGMMNKMMPGQANTPQTTYKKVASGEKVNQWVCDKYEGTREGEKRAEVWTTPPKKLDIAESDVEVMKDMGKFFEKFAKSMEDMFGGAFSKKGPNKNGFEGIPVKTLSYKDGKPDFETEMKEVKKENIDASLFEIPTGLTKKSMGKMGKE